MKLTINVPDDWGLEEIDEVIHAARKRDGADISIEIDSRGMGEVLRRELQSRLAVQVSEVSQ